MGLKEIKKYNDQNFIDDLKNVSECMAFCDLTEVFIKVRKLEIRKISESKKIKYYITDELFKVKRDVMIII